MTVDCGGTARPRRIAARLHGCAFALLALSGCGGGGGDVWFPLDPGHQWSYDVSFRSREQERRFRHVVRNLAPVTLDGVAVVPRITLDGHLLYLREAADGSVERVGHRLAETVEDIEGGRTLLPASPVPGTAWQVTMKPLLLERIVKEINAGQASLAGGANFVKALTFDFSVLETGVALGTAAGRWKDCLHVAGKAQGVMGEGSELGRFDVTAHYQEWYCRGVGLVRVLREEEVDQPWAGRSRYEQVLARHEVR